jgi:hypothetical protein
MTTKNPFPGMNPFFEQRWRDAHISLITYISSLLNESLPERSFSKIEVKELVPDEKERWIQLHDETGRLITVIELLSPANKRETREREHYASRRQTFINGGVNLMEIDLVRQGTSIFPPAVQDTLNWNHIPYAVCVFRATRSKENTVYPIRLRERLPVLAVPLRPTDADVPLDLQPLVDQCHEKGRYHLLNYKAPLLPPLSAEDSAWVDQVLRKNGLR